MRKYLAGLAIALVSLTPAVASAAPIVSYTVSGSANDWLLNFSVTNNLGGSNDIYFFGVELPRDIAGSPAGWNPDSTPSWNTALAGGPNILFNNVWLETTLLAPSIQNGETLDGFMVHSALAVAPVSVRWFAHAANGQYLGGDNFYQDTNPGFVGTAEFAPAAVPEPASLVLLGSGLASVIAKARRRKQHLS